MFSKNLETLLQLLGSHFAMSDFEALFFFSFVCAGVCVYFIFGSLGTAIERFMFLDYI